MASVMTRYSNLWLGMLCLALTALPGQAQTRYRVSFPEATQNRIQVEARYPTGGEDQVELFLPVWTPGVYAVLNYSQRVDQLRATGENGQPLCLQPLSQSRWRVECEGQSEITLFYRLKGGDRPSISGNYVDAGKAVLQGAATYISPVTPVQSTFEVTVELPAAWESIHTGLPPAADGERGHYLAKDIDQLIDCPIVAGSTVEHEFRVAGVPHSLVYLGQTCAPWDHARAVRDVQAIVGAHHRMWGVFPFAQEPPGRYWFLSVRGVAGGLEHKNSTCLAWHLGEQFDRESEYLQWLGLIAHEYFHTWNGKNLRPITLGPFDYEARTDTPSLWIVEGLTTYYSSLILVRSNLLTPDGYLKTLSHQISRVKDKRWVSLTEASMRDWDPGSKLTSFYSGGAVVGFLLDQKIRQATDGRASLDDLMRQAYQRYSEERGYTEEQFEALASQVAGIDLNDFFRSYVHGTEPLDFSSALRYYGLKFQPDPNLSARHHLGIATVTPSERLVLDWLVRGSPAERAGLEKGDELLAVDGVPVESESELNSLLRRCGPDGTVELLVGRQGQSTRFRLAVGGTLQIDPQASPESRAHWNEYLRGQTESAG